MDPHFHLALGLNSTDCTIGGMSQLRPARAVRGSAPTIAVGSKWHSGPHLAVYGLAWYRACMGAGARPPMPPRLKRTLELAYAVDGVVAAKVWQWPGRIAVGIRGSGSETDLLRRVASAVAGLRDADENWEFGILDDGPPERSPLPQRA